MEYLDQLRIVAVEIGEQLLQKRRPLKGPIARSNLGYHQSLMLLLHAYTPDIRDSPPGTLEELRALNKESNSPLQFVSDG